MTRSLSLRDMVIWTADMGFQSEWRKSCGFITRMFPEYGHCRYRRRYRKRSVLVTRSRCIWNNLRWGTISCSLGRADEYQPQCSKKLRLILLSTENFIFLFISCAFTRTFQALTCYNEEFANHRRGFPPLKFTKLLSQRRAVHRRLCHDQRQPLYVHAVR